MQIAVDKRKTADKDVIILNGSGRARSMRVFLRDPLLQPVTSLNVYHFLKKPRTSNVGRLRASIDDLPKDWKDLMFHEASRGGGPHAYMVALGIHNHAFERLLYENESFRDLFVICQSVSRLWWETVGRRLAVTGVGSAAVWAMNMTNKFGWKSGRNEMVGDPEAPLQTENKNKQLTKEELLVELEARGLPTNILMVEEK